jgi:hypothetical protein
MAFAIADLKKVAGGSVGIWHYSSTDAISTIIGTDYFLAATSELKVNDIIRCVGSTGGTRSADLVVVSTNSGTSVATINGTA